MSVTQYLTELTKDKREQAVLFRDVAESINVNHKRFTSATFAHDDAYKSTDSYYGPVLSVRYQQVTSSLSRRYDVFKVNLRDTKTSVEMTPVQVKSVLLMQAEAFEDTANKLEVELKTLQAKRDAISDALRTYNGLVDGLTPYARDALGIQHIYNYKLETA